MIDNPEFGYTPNNLKNLRTKYNLTQKQVAEITNTANYNTVARWETETNSKKIRADMPHTKWETLIKHLTASAKKNETHQPPQTTTK